MFNILILLQFMQIQMTSHKKKIVEEKYFVYHFCLGIHFLLDKTDTQMIKIFYYQNCMVLTPSSPNQKNEMLGQYW